MSNTVLVRATNLTRYYSQTCAVDDVSFDLARGDVLGFLGPNGAGKSSTMQMLTGNLAPGAGGVEITGIDLLEQPRRAKLEIGYLPEQPPVYRELTVDEYLAYCARLNRIARNRQAAAVDTAKQRCGLTEVGRRLIGNLSKGYQQRVGIAQAIIHTPAVVILDEPTVGLDPIQIREIRDLIRELGQDHGIILSTHILPEVQATCNRVQIIHRGRLVYSDTLSGMERQHHVSTLLVRFNGNPDPEALLNIPGIERLQVLEDGRFRLHFAGDDPSETVVGRAVERGWRLAEITPERSTLEQVFIELTTGDGGMPQREAAA